MLVVRGQTAHFIVSYDTALSDGPSLADAVLAHCEQDLATLSLLFGGIMPDAASLPFQVALVPGGGGGGHPGCLSTAITIHASNSDALGVPSIVVAEAAEVLMATQGRGFDCGASNGEALSRVAAQILYPQIRNRWSTGNEWLNSANPARPDWVSNTQPTDQVFASIGCGSLFLNYLAHQLNYRWPDIVAAAAPTLAETATKLEVPNPFGDFAALLAQYFPPGVRANLPDDDPFPLGTPDVPVPYLLGLPLAAATRVLKSVGLEVGDVEDTTGEDPPPPGYTWSPPPRVTDQSPPPRRPAPRGSSVDLELHETLRKKPKSVTPPLPWPS